MRNSIKIISDICHPTDNIIIDDNVSMNKTSNKNIVKLYFVLGESII